jgi:hypothetical protein
MFTAVIVHFMFVVLPPCEHEDSSNCSWNAQTTGNGVGDSFVDIDGTTFYLNGEVVRYSEPPTICHSAKQHQCLWVEGTSTWHD